MHDMDIDVRELALEAMTTAWSSLNADDRNSVIDLLSQYDEADYILALRTILHSDSLDPKIAAQIRAVLDDSRTAA